MLKWLYILKPTHVCTFYLLRMSDRRLASADPTVPTAPAMRLPIPNRNPNPIFQNIFNPNPNPFLKENKNDTGI